MKAALYALAAIGAVSIATAALAAWSVSRKFPNPDWLN